MFRVWTVKFPEDKDDRINSECAYFKMLICKHIVGLAIRLKFTAEAKTIPIGV